MQNKKTLLQRLLVIYITFFIVLVASIAHSFVTDFYRGRHRGVELGEDLAEKWNSGTPPHDLHAGRTDPESPRKVH